MVNSLCFELLFIIDLDMGFSSISNYGHKFITVKWKMPRPCKSRWVQAPPPVPFYRPDGVPFEDLQGVVLSMDGFEALRLADAKRFDHETAAALMGVSRPTFSRLLAQARMTVATALANGWALRIDGGSFRFAASSHEEDGPRCGRRRHRRGRHKKHEEGQE